jgi:hypothetical protein
LGTINDTSLYTGGYLLTSSNFLSFSHHCFVILGSLDQKILISGTHLSSIANLSIPNQNAHQLYFSGSIHNILKTSGFIIPAPKTSNHSQS